MSLSRARNEWAERREWNLQQWAEAGTRSLSSRHHHPPASESSFDSCLRHDAPIPIRIVCPRNYSGSDFSLQPLSERSQSRKVPQDSFLREKKGVKLLVLCLQAVH
jgi:hypothetical protein